MFIGYGGTCKSLIREHFKEPLQCLADSNLLEIKQHYEKLKNVFSVESKNIKN